MSRRSKIRWKNNELEELRKLTRSYNAKLKRERDKLINQDKRYEAAHLPGKSSLVELKHMSRKEMEKERARMTAYVKTGQKYAIDKKTDQSLHSTVRDFNAKVDRLTKNIEKETKRAILDRQALKREMKGLQKSSEEYKALQTKIDELNNIVNAKQGRLAALPEKIKRDQLVREAGDSKELQNNLKVFRGFLKAGSEELVDVPNNNNDNIKETKWQRDIFSQYKPGIDARRERELQEWKDAEAKFGGESTGLTHEQLGMKNEDYRLQPLNIYNPSSTNADLKKKLKLVMREKNENYWNARTELARINYLETMDSLIGDEEVGKTLMKTIGSMSVKDFKRVLTENDDLWQLLYDLKHADNKEAVLQKIWAEWRKDDYFEWYEAWLDKKANSIE